MTAPDPARAAATLGPHDVVHELKFGTARCRGAVVKGLPHEWPQGHSWARGSDFLTIPLANRCPHCARARVTDR